MAGVPPVRDRLTSNCLKAEVSVRKVQMVKVEAIMGILMANSVRNGLAPSMAEASMTSRGTCCRPVM